MKARFHPGAHRDLSEGYRWYENRSRRAAARFLEKVSTTLDRIIESPARHRQVSDGSKFRTLKVTRYPYHLIYRIIDDGIVVMAVAHEKRRPGYWHRRID